MREEQLQLRRLARALGVQTEYVDVLGKRRKPRADVLLAVLRALGLPLRTPAEAPDALRRHEDEWWSRRAEPVYVVAPGCPAVVEIRAATAGGSGTVEGHLALEHGDDVDFSRAVDDLRRRGSARIGDTPYAILELPLPRPLPPGYHRLTLAIDGRWTDSLLIASPSLAFGADGDERLWGVFLPLYALHRESGWPHGDFGDLRALGRWATGLGASLLGTLPLLAAYLDEPFEPSPYAPVSRRFWNELYVDPDALPEAKTSSGFRRLMRSPGFRSQLDRLRAAPFVDYRESMRLKRRALEELARTAFARPPEDRQALESFVARKPEVIDYARYRAMIEQHGTNRVPRGEAAGRAADTAAERYHVYAQWAAEEQLAGLGSADGAGLYLDFPLGVHPDGYDVWREPEIFANGVSVGAPPDDFFSLGQDWGFPPLHPAAIRRQQYRYWIACLDHHCRHAEALRLDHVMGLHRLFWIPSGADARDGVYVRYPARELYAVLRLESLRHRCRIVGEDLGTVPRDVRPAMRRHGVRRMYVLQLEAPGTDVPRGALACLNTHDMPTFAAYWRGLDVDERAASGLLDATAARRERSERERVRRTLARRLARGGSARRTTRAALEGCLTHLADSRAAMVLVNLEDLWLETRPQNVPGSGPERPNWKRKARHSLETFSRMPRVLGPLRRIDRRRRERT